MGGPSLLQFQATTDDILGRVFGILPGFNRVSECWGVQVPRPAVVLFS